MYEKSNTISPAYERLVVWQRACTFVVAIYESTKKLPTEERYGLVSQMRRAAVSISSNIAEGKCRQSRKDFRRFLFHALGSAAEVDTQIFIAHRCGLMSDEDAHSLRHEAQEIMRMLGSLIASNPLSI